YYTKTGFLAGLNADTLDAAWRLANPRMGGLIGSLEDILSRAVLIGGIGRDIVRIYDSARADALRVQISATTLKPFQPDDPSVASPEEIAKDPLQQRIDFSQLDLAPRYGDDGPTGAIALNSFEVNEVYLGAGNDRVDVTSAILPLFIYAGGGDDEFFVGSTPDNALTSNLDGIQNTIITLDGGTGSTRLVVSRGGDDNPTGTVEVTDSAIVVRHFASDDLALAPIVSSVRYLADVTNSRVLAGSYRGEIRAGFDRGVVLYTGEGDDRSVQVKSIRSEAPTVLYLGAGDDRMSVLPTMADDGAQGEKDIGLTNDRTGDPHDMLHVFGMDGHDRIDLTKALVNVRAFGGAGDDVLLGSTGVDILVGGLGNDELQGYGAALLNNPAADSLWGEQIEVLVGDDLGRLFFVQEGANSVTYRLPGLVDQDSHYFDGSWMEDGGNYFFARSDSPGQFFNLADALDARGVVVRDDSRNYRGGDPYAIWYSLSSPQETLDLGGNDRIFSGVALPNKLGLSTGSDEAVTALSGTNVVFGGAGRDRIFLGNVDAAHGHGHIIIGDEAQLELNRTAQDGTRTRDIELEDIAAPRPPQNGPRAEDWVHYGRGDAYVLAGSGHDVVIGGLSPDGTDAGTMDRSRILTDMGRIRLLDDTTELSFMTSAADQPGADDTVIVGADHVDWIGGGGSDRLWAGYQIAIDPADPFGDQFDGVSPETGLTLTEVFG
ncbi:MAG: calcium-binding protein, partial [Alphaproteobacteria bacterium]|nr:calcium-binding protein [Alphaproteobacteria bacterium]